MVTRREFLNVAGAGAAGLAIGSTAKSYGQIMGSNDRVNFAVIGIHARGKSHVAALKTNQAVARAAYICDVDRETLSGYAGEAEHLLGYAPGEKVDFREILAQKDVDAITIATPDHWHTPMAILGLQAGKHVYVEKPCSHNPAEGALLVEAQRKYGKLVQMGTQSRSSGLFQEVVDKIHNGLIGRAYFAKAWYSNKRESIGVGKEVQAPPQLDWDLWQGPAPRRPYRSNIQPYNWHWFRIYGTGEALNNGTHEVDVCRWALDADFPQTVTASGGRYQFKDDWQFYDTFVTSLDYGDKTISWECRSCQHMKFFGQDRGMVITGTEGSVVASMESNTYEIYNTAGERTAAIKHGDSTAAASTDLVGVGSMTDNHFANFIAGIQKGEKLNAPIAVGNVTVTTLQLSNIAWEAGRELNVDPSNGKIRNDPEAMKMWGREYEKGWAPHL